ncbi:hypothetical protein DY120_07470 [Apilactobacillus micheneri]|uniref:Phage protein n=2 Tax=Apilactobacillus micheneri TaxID=1899430 RepID=A0ABY2YVA1_9LACO|nr:hypothetical protein [Apilactobacillus micheneri]TPR23137.1 hypothetical protein DY114_07455 [Apilactobacillus micheneri]TPR24455.1 hypothetical protein DY111_07470 [Apilactobacillus micheneri]TPR29402.1 hypothetical protein DY120_07470 [Apilactobacillus micheneri]TPR34609.1 hypothetical protein DY027_07460 [Apilactobacillus micheneri]
MYSVLDRTVGVLKEQLDKYAIKNGFKGLTSMQSDQISEKAPYPIIAIDVIDPFIQIGYTPDYPNFNMRIQLKAESDDLVEFHNLLEYLRRLFFLQLPSQEMTSKHVYPQSEDVLAITKDYEENITVYTGGIDLLVTVVDDQPDYTEDGQMDTVTTNFRKDG